MSSKETKETQDTIARVKMDNATKRANRSSRNNTVALLNERDAINKNTASSSTSTTNNSSSTSTTNNSSSTSTTSSSKFAGIDDNGAVYTTTSDYDDYYYPTTTSDNSSTSTTSSSKFAGIGDESVYTTTSDYDDYYSDYYDDYEYYSPTTSYSSRVYSGGDQVILDYQSGEQIVLGTTPTGWIFGGGNFALGSATGNLFIANANDKVINFTDAAGNSVAKAYAATNAGTIDGRGLAGYEYIVGSDAGADIIFAGDGGSQLWGGNGLGADALIGGAGTDMFIGGKYQGADVFANASSADIVNLNDVTLGDIVAASESNNVISLAFNTGNVIAVGSSELLSSAFVLADGSAWRFNHVTKSWQSA